MDIPKAHTFRRALEEGINLFLGAGFSIGAQDYSNEDLPLGPKLAQELNGVFKTNFNLPLSNLCTVLKGKDSEKLDGYLSSRFKVKSYYEDYKYQSLYKVNIKNIFTVNIDDLIINLYKNSKNKYINNVISGNGLSVDEKNSINYIALHGFVVSKNKYIFSTFDLASAFKNETGLWSIFITALSQYPTLFIGYGFNDQGTIQSLTESGASNAGVKEIWATVADNKDNADAYLSAININPILAKTNDILEYIDNTALASTDINASNAIAETTLNKLKRYIIPLDDNPVRPIRDFFLGDAPIWYDIQSNLIAKTSYYSELCNLIDSGDDVIIAGISGAGKTTLLMQAAFGYKTNKLKLICTSPTKEEAEFICANTEGHETIIFCDQFASDIDSFRVFSSASHIQLIAADREHFINIIGHLLTDESLKELNITDLEDEDLEKIRQKIPKELFSSSTRLNKNDDISLYEFIEGNINRSTLNERYVGVIKEIDSKDSRLCDLLLLISYVYSCRSPASYSMIHSFFGKEISSYSELFELIDILNSLINDTSTYINCNEDFFRPRSSLISEAILNSCVPGRLSEFFNKFFDRLSPALINRFDVFRKQAFDARVMSRAFADAEDGIEFYKKMLNYDDSPYIKQQFAIYLMHKKKFNMSFNMIDRAIVETNGKNFSIKNTHAIILFRANINKDSSDPNVINTIRESMDILSKCYYSDKRRLYHVKVFAGHAIQFREIYGADKAKEYISTANSWVKKGLEDQPLNRDLKRLSKQLKPYVE